LLLYLIGWLFLPDEGQQHSPVESLIGRGRGGSTAEAALLAISAILLAVLLVRGDAGDLALLAVVVVGLVLILRNVDQRRQSGPAAPHAAPPSYPGPPYRQPAPYGATEQAWTGAEAVTDPQQTAGATTGVLPPYGDQPPPPVSRVPSMLGRVAVSVALVGVGVLGLLDRTGVVEPRARHYLALALAVLGAALVVGAFVGRARWLIWLGVPLTVALVGVSTAQDAWRGGTGERHIRPVSVSDLQPRYELGAGGVEMDLSDVDFSGQSASTDLHVGLGNVLVVLPPDVDVTVHATTGAGAMDLLGNHVDGAGVDKDLVDDGSDGTGGGTLDLVLDVGLGHVEVRRAAA
jgi:hypothetical protein